MFHKMAELTAKAKSGQSGNSLLRLMRSAPRGYRGGQALRALPVDLPGLLCAAGGECEAKQAPGGGHVGRHRQAAGRAQAC